MTTAIRVIRGDSFAWQSPLSRAELTAVLAAMRDTCGLGGTPVALTLAGDAFVSRINIGQLGCGGPTNILSFPPFITNAGPVTDADSGTALLLLSLDTLERECLLYGQDKTEHAVRLLAHGMAHISGLSHGPVMDSVQDAAFAAGMRVVEQRFAGDQASLSCGFPGGGKLGE